MSIGVIAGIVLGVFLYGKGRVRRNKGGFFRLDEKDGLLGGNTNGGKVD